MVGGEVKRPGQGGGPGRLTVLLSPVRPNRGGPGGRGERSKHISITVLIVSTIVINQCGVCHFN